MDRPSAGLRRRTTADAGDLRDSVAAPPPQELRHPRKRKGFAVSKMKKPSKVSSSSTSMASSTTEHHQGRQNRNLNCMLEDDFLDLALSLGMSFAAVISQVLCGKIVSRDQLPAENLSMICTSAVKESVSNIHGDKFDSFMRNFERSFDSTLKTLLVFNKASTSSQKNKLREERPLTVGNKLINESNNDEQENRSYSSLGVSSCEIEQIPCSLDPLSCEEHLGEDEAVSSTNQLALRIESNQELVRASHNFIAGGFSKSMLTTFEKSVTEHTRSNDLKEVEIGLTMRKLQMKQSQLEMSSYANWLEKVKICMNMSKASFKEDKLRNQMQETRHAELRRNCIDLLVSGLILMCAFLIYGASIFSYQRITEATSSCSTVSRGTKSWWMPKQMASVSSGWQVLRCHAVVITRMLFGLLMIVVIAYSLLQRSAISGSTMPITSILLLLGVACGIAGKLCVDSLGGSGYHWVIYWEALCLLHLFANIFPSILYFVLYGPVLVAKREKPVWLPYWIRRYTFYGILLLVLPTMAGLLPFTSLIDWKDHFTEKIMALISKAEQKS
ncbi:protein CPR-5 [Dendrobium catenatum]|uniref:protein CPR-5 n=1 Tax=Dendrobium catenatum TaxID=906689 RepID=UPI0009F6A3E0|nr:protein CPR-5 [Dendrobium catenatum]